MLCVLIKHHTYAIAKFRSDNCKFKTGYRIRYQHNKNDFHRP